MKKLYKSMVLVTSMLLFFVNSFVTWAQTGWVQIGTGTTTQNASSAMPITNYVYNYSQQIITATQIADAGGVAGVISGIQYNISNTSPVTDNWKNWKIWLGNTTKESFVNTNASEWIPQSDMTLVFDGDITANGAWTQGWNTLPFSNDFTYTGGNLVITVHENTAGYLSYPTFYTYNKSNAGLIYYKDGEDFSNQAASSLRSNVPQVKLMMPLNTCLKPTSGVANYLVNGDRQIQWTPGASETQWEVVWGPVGFTPGAANQIGQQIVSQPSLTLVGLNQYTNYAVYVRSLCDDVMISSWLSLTSNGLCIPSSGSNQTYISKFSATSNVGAISNTSGYTQGGFADYSSSQTLLAQANSSVDFSLEFVGGTIGASIWIDFNDNFTYEASERVYTSGGYQPNTINSSFLIPAGVAEGPHTMRVLIDYTSSSPTNACVSSNRMEAEEYTILVLSAPNDPTIGQVADVPTCDMGTQLVMTSAPQEGFEYYWQTTAEGTSTANSAVNSWTVYNNATYFLRAYTPQYQSWFNAVSYEVTNIPIAPSPVSPLVSQTTACVTEGATMLMPNAPTDVVYYWMGTDSSSYSIDLPATEPYIASQSGRYFVKAFDVNSGCWSEAIGTNINIETAVPSKPQIISNEIIECTGVASAPVSVMEAGSSTAVYSSGSSNPTSYLYTVTNASVSACPINISVPVPSGQVVTGVDVMYSMTAATGYYKSSQRSFLKCVSPGGTAESTVAQGTGSSAGTQTYNRTGLTIANGIVSNGSIDFQLMAFRTSGGSGCNTTYNYVDDGSIKVVVYYGEVIDGVKWYDAAEGGNLLGDGYTIDPIGTSALPDANVAGEYKVYATATIGTCESLERTEATIYLNKVKAELAPIDASCHNLNDGSFTVTSVNCGVNPFTYIVNGVEYATIPTDLVAGVYSIVLKDQNGDVSFPTEIEISQPQAPTQVVVDSYVTNEATIVWVANGNESAWNIEWGAPGFIPGSGTSIGAAIANDTFYTINLLDASTNYDVYVSANCGANSTAIEWDSINFTTDCAPILGVNFCEDFENASTLDCWKVINNNNDDRMWNRTSSSTYANSGSNYFTLHTDYKVGNHDDYLVLPRVTLTGNEVLKFSTRSRALNSEVDYLRVVVSTTGFKAEDFIHEVMPATIQNWTTYRDTTLDLSQFSGDVYIAFHMPQLTTDGFYIHLDDVCIDVCNPIQAQDATLEVCRSQQQVDLNTVIDSEYDHGTWTFPTISGALNGSTLNYQFLAAGTYTATYTVMGACSTVETVASITVVDPSFAGGNHTISACKNQMIDLVGALGYDASLNGTWFAPNGSVITETYFKTGSIPGNYVYHYVVENGPCDNDTATIMLNIGSCDYLGMDDMEKMELITVSPNPSNGLYQLNGASELEVQYEVLDLNGRVLLSPIKFESTSTTLDLREFPNGVYILRIFNENSQRLNRLIKQ